MHRRKVTAATLRRWDREGRSQGAGSAYQPGIQVRRTDPSSHGTSSVECDVELGRTRHMLTRFQSCVCLALRHTRHPHVKDIKENYQFPLNGGEHPLDLYTSTNLEPIRGSVEIARSAGLRHPMYGAELAMPKQLVTPLLVIAAPSAIAETATAIPIVLDHRAQVPGKAARPRHQLLRCCWESAGAKLVTYPKWRMTAVIHQNLILISESTMWPEGSEPTDPMIATFVLQVQQQDWSLPAWQVLASIARQMRIDRAAAVRLYKHALWKGHLTSDLTRPLWRLTSQHPRPTPDPQPLPEWHPLYDVEVA